MNALIVFLFFQALQPHVRISNLEKRIFDLVNIERVKAKIAPLKLDSKLSGIAREHSRAMAANGFFDHVNPAGLGPSERAKAARYECRRQEGVRIYQGLGENILQNNLYSREIIRGNQTSYDWNSEEQIAATTVRGWMDSPEHRANILNSRYVQSGIGIAISSRLQVLITQDFC